MRVAESTHAIVLAGGRGTRLEPYSHAVPKVLMPIADTVLIEHHFVRLRAAGVRRITIALGHLAAVVETWLAENPHPDLDITVSKEPSPAGTGAAVRRALAHVASDARVIVLNGDLLTGHDLGAHLRASHSFDVCLHVRVVDDPRRFGSVTLDGDVVTAFVEKPEHPTSRWVSAGTTVFAPGILDAVGTNEPLSLEHEVLPELIAADYRVGAYREQAYFCDVGRPEDLLRASIDAITARGDDSWVDSQAVVDPTARLFGGTVVHAEARVGAGAVLDGVLVMPGAVVAPGRYLDHVIADPR